MEQPGDKPRLTVVRPNLDTVEGVMDMVDKMYRNLTGHEATPEDEAETGRIAERIVAKRKARHDTKGPDDGQTQ